MATTTPGSASPSSSSPVPASPASAATAPPATALAAAAAASPGVPDPNHPLRVVVSLDRPARADTPGRDAGLAAVDALLRSVDSLGAGLARRATAVVVVIHGDATGLALRQPSDGAGSTSGSTLSGAPETVERQLNALEREGVRFVVSDRSLQLRGRSAADVRSGIGIAPSAVLAFLDLESRGYAYTSVAGLSME